MIRVRVIKGTKPLKFELIKTDKNYRDKIIYQQIMKAKLLWKNTRNI